MNEMLIALGGAYLIALAVLGYVGMLAAIHSISRWPKWVTAILVLMHFIFGVVGLVVVPALAYRLSKDSLPGSAWIVVALVEIVMLCIVFLVLKRLKEQRT